MPDSHALLFEAAREDSDAPATTTAAAMAGTLGEDVESVPIASLVPGYSPRLQGEDAAHVARLAELDEPLPPILVERSTLRVIDGMHRVMAACAQGRTTIEARFFDGAAEEAFLLAVRSNTAHGLPLSREDRRAAAERILAQWPHLSDRAVARTAGIGAKTVAALRSASDGATPHPRARRGRDGRVRPLDGSEGRWKAAELLAERPRASLREVAREAGISPATVSDVRKRLVVGRSPVPEPRTTDDAHDAHRTHDAPREAPAVVHPIQPVHPAQPVQPVRSADVSPMDKLLRDPSLRHKESGRQLLRLLQRNALEPRELLLMAEVVPAHCTDLVADLARKYAGMWAQFAREVGDSG
ncbi:ParB/RepB/Spo0J family partition protein [Streptomyces longispororuber]|uniref:ParB/RepB/Spo0J family partition protein n=1 Tax=Streptomyces longispororuber TaxID=68230 RepID=UPI00210B09D5|nr:helix-turn-helix domain-containing protein [Streptomyces longispororuber]MCQ4206634.1 helix-turn-helix domain-containing protein [Streptomyces longispororuber]